MAKRHKKASKPPENPPTQSEIPPGAMRKAWDRAVDPGGGPPGSGAGPRHAADDTGSENETYGSMETNWTLASPPLDPEDPLEKGPPYSGRAGGAVGGTPAQGRSAEILPDSESPPEAAILPAQTANAMPPAEHDDTIRLTGVAAIEYAEKHDLTLHKHPDSITGPRVSVSVAEAEAIADDDPDLIWLDVSTEDYYNEPPSSYEPGR